MGLKIILLAGFAIVLAVGFCIVGVATGETDISDETPFTVTMYESFTSVIEWFTGTDEDAAGGSAPEGGS